MKSLDLFADQKLAELTEKGLRRRFVPTQSRGLDAKVFRQGKLRIPFASNDYLGLTQHPDVISAACDAACNFGAGGGAARLVLGEHPLLGLLETNLSRFLQTEASLVFGSGFLTNIGVIPAVVGKQDLVILDEYAHASLVVGSRVARSEVLTFKHNSMSDISEVLQKHRSRYKNCLVVSEGIFSMDGDAGEIKELSALCKAHDAWLLVDDAHAIGIGEHGRGVCSGFDVDLRVGTFSKAFGSYGGYVAASQSVIELMRHRARSSVYTTSLPPSVVAASINALDIISADPVLRNRPVLLAQQFAKTLGLPKPAGAIVPIVIGSPQDALAAAQKLDDLGFLVPAIRPPTVPVGTSRLRFTFSALHKDEEVQALIEAVRSNTYLGNN